jgi:hypothetical protein
MTSSVGSIPTQITKAAPATFKQALFVAVTAGLGYGFDSYAVNIYGLVLPEIKKTLHITDAQAGYIGSIFLLGYTIGTVGFGFAADRWGRKTTLGASILLYGVRPRWPGSPRTSPPSRDCDSSPVWGAPENSRSARHTPPRFGQRRPAPSVSAA